MKNTLFGILISLLVFWGAGELFVLIFEQAEPKTPPYDTALKDDYMGWKPKGDYHFIGQMKDSKNEPYDIEIRTAPNGFRSYDDPNTDKRKILFIGDSYTQAVEVSNDKTFYHLLRDSLDIAVFAHGMAGYGNAQHFMMLRQYLAEVQPDMVVLQVCCNDFIDNYHLLEMESIYQVGLRRPYIYQDSTIEYHLPKPGIGPKIQWSGFFTFIYEKLRHLKKANTDPEQMAEGLIANQGLDYPLFARSVEITEHLLQLIREEVGDIPLLVFSSDLFEPQLSEMANICDRLDIPFTNAPSIAIRDAQQAKQTVNSIDGYHWNEAGHAVVGRALLPFLR